MARETYKEFADVLRNAEGRYRTVRNAEIAMTEDGEWEYCAHGILCAEIVPSVVEQVKKDLSALLESDRPATQYMPLGSLSYEEPLLQREVNCPTKEEDTRDYVDTVDVMIVYLWDGAKWSLGQIADWLEELDNGS